MEPFESFTGDMSINLGRRQIGMSQHNLDAPEVGPVFQKVRGERVPESVRRNILDESCLTGTFFYYIPESLSRHSFPQPADEK